MEAEAERTLNNLHVLAALSHNDKLMTNEDLFDIYPPTSARSVFRMWYGESRNQNVQRVRQTVRAGINFASKTLEDANALLARAEADEGMTIRIETVTIQHIRMVDALHRAHRGLSNLLQTYRDDPALTSQIGLLNVEIDDFVRVMRSHSEPLRRRCPVQLSCPPAAPAARAET